MSVFSTEKSGKKVNNLKIYSRFNLVNANSCFTFALP